MDKESAKEIGGMLGYFWDMMIDKDMGGFWDEKEDKEAMKVKVKMLMKKKTWGSMNPRLDGVYTLVSNWAPDLPYNCLDSCIYERKRSPGKMFCFAPSMMSEAECIAGEGQEPIEMEFGSGMKPEGYGSEMKPEGYGSEMKPEGYGMKPGGSGSGMRPEGSGSV